MVRCWVLATALLSTQVMAEPVTLDVVTEVWPPFLMVGENGKLYGLDIDLLDEISRRSGYHFNVRRAPWARGLAGMRSGSVDVMAGLSKTEQREAYIDYLEPSYFSCTSRFYANPALAEKITEYSQLADLSIGYVLDSAYFEPFDSDAQLNKVAVTNESQLLEMLARGRIQAFVGTDCQVDYELQDPQKAQGIAKAAFVPEVNSELYIGFSRKGAHAEAKQKVSQVLEQLREEGWMTRRALRYGLAR